MMQVEEFEEKLVLVLDIQAKYEQILLQQAESMNRLMGTVDKLAGHTERMLDLIELMSGRIDRSDERAERFEKILDRLVQNSDRQAAEIRAVMDTQKMSDERIRNLVSAMGRFIVQHSTAPA